MSQLDDLLRALMTPLQHEYMIQKQQIWDLAMRIDPKFWEAVIRESYAEAAEKVDADLKDQRTSPRVPMGEMKVYWKLKDKVKVLEKKIP